MGRSRAAMYATTDGVSPSPTGMAVVGGRSGADGRLFSSSSSSLFSSVGPTVDAALWGAVSFALVGKKKSAVLGEEKEANGNEKEKVGVGKDEKEGKKDGEDLGMEKEGGKGRVPPDEVVRTFHDGEKGCSPLFSLREAGGAVGMERAEEEGGVEAIPRIKKEDESG